MRKNEVYFGCIGIYTHYFVCILIILSSASSLFFNPKPAYAAQLSDNTENIQKSSLSPFTDLNISNSIAKQSNISAIEITEGNPSQWGSNWLDLGNDVHEDTPAIDTVIKNFGNSSIYFETESPADWWAYYPKTRNAEWDLSGVTHLSFWLKLENLDDFEDIFQVVLGDSATGGYYIYQPLDEMDFYDLPLQANGAFISIPLASGENWLRSISGEVSLEKIDYIEFRTDTWGAGFKVWIDGLYIHHQGRITLQSPSIIADGETSTQLTVAVTDALGNPLAGQEVFLALQKGEALYTPSQSVVRGTPISIGLTNATGIVSTTVTATHPGERVIVAQTPDAVYLGSKRLNVNYGVDFSPTLIAPSYVQSNSNLVYNIHVSNIGDKTATGTRLTFYLPQNTTLVSYTFPISPTQNGSLLTWNIDDTHPQITSHYAISVHVPSSVTMGSYITSTVSIDSNDIIHNRYNDTVEAWTRVDQLYRGHVALGPYSQAIRGTTGITSEIVVWLRNTGYVKDTYTPILQGLPSGWVTAPQPISIAPGGVEIVRFEVRPTTCLAEAEIPFTVTAVSQVETNINSNQGTMSVSGDPTIYVRSPQHGVKTGSRTQTIDWSTDAEATSVLTVYPEGQPELAQTYTTPLGTRHQVTLPNLTRNQAYEWYVTATSLCGETTSRDYKFTVTNGVVFHNQEMRYEIDRDYEQLVTVNVINRDVITRTMTMTVEDSFEDLIINFVGDGSTDKPIVLLPGQREQIQLSIHAQDTLKQDYDITARIYAEDAQRDAAVETGNIHIYIKKGGLDIEPVSVDPIDGSRIYKVTARDYPVTDLSIKARDPITGEPADIYITPNVNHARLEPDQSLEVKVIPYFGPEDMSPSMSAVGSKLYRYQNTTQPGRDFDLVVGSAGEETVVPDERVACPPGKQIYKVTRTNVGMRVSAADWYCTNRPDIDIPLLLPPFVNPNNVGLGLLSMDIGPGGGGPVRPHTTNIYFNENHLHTLTGIPNGSYQWQTPSSSLRAADKGLTTQMVNLRTSHPNKGHYQVATNFQLGLGIKELTVYVCASSQEEAEEIVERQYGLEPQPTDFSVDIIAPTTSGTVLPDENFSIAIAAQVTDDLPPNATDYLVKAEITYVDAPEIAPESITLMNDGQSTGTYTGKWVPQVNGEIKITVVAESYVGQRKTDTITIRPHLLPDLVIEKVSTRSVSFINNYTEAIAVVANKGFGIQQPIWVKFEYYVADPLTGEPSGDPQHTSYQRIPLDQHLKFGESVPVYDYRYDTIGVGVYVVVATVDAPPEGEGEE
jgi:uncharacterized repeat protein (TIGR01451 family)